MHSSTTSFPDRVDERSTSAAARDASPATWRRVGIASRLSTLPTHSCARRGQDDAAGAYVLATSAVLPFADRCFDVAVAYNSLQVVDDMAATVSEAGRVLDRGGYLCICVAHPVTDLGHFVDDDDAAFTLRHRYFETVRVDDTVQRGGLTMNFLGWTYTLEQYALALEQAGFRIEAMREPRPIDAAANFERWREVPLFLFLRAVKA